MSNDLKNVFSLAGKVALVTGASRGIGEAIAKLFAAHGAEVIVSSRKADGCQVVADAINADGGKAHVMPCHAGNIDDMTRLIDDIADQFGKLDILVNNAAANPFFGHVLDTPLDAIDKTIEVNLRGYFVMSQLAGRLMKKNGGGSIVNTASINGVRPGQFQSIYSVTKASVINTTQAFAKECASLGIRVNAVLPGLTETKFASALTQNEDLLKRFLPLIPMQRVADPSEIAPAVLYLASDAASYTTGSCITVDGGYLS